MFRQGFHVMSSFWWLPLEAMQWLSEEAAPIGVVLLIVKGTWYVLDECLVACRKSKHMLPGNGDAVVATLLLLEVRNSKLQLMEK